MTTKGLRPRQAKPVHPPEELGGGGGGGGGGSGRRIVGVLTRNKQLRSRDTAQNTQMVKHGQSYQQDKTNECAVHFRKKGGLIVIKATVIILSFHERSILLC